jgi:hypothetical protein
MKKTQKNEKKSVKNSKNSVKNSKNSANSIDKKEKQPFEITIPKIIIRNLNFKVKRHLKVLE